MEYPPIWVPQTLTAFSLGRIGLEEDEANDDEDGDEDGDEDDKDDLNLCATQLPVTLDGFQIVKTFKNKEMAKR